MKLLTKQFKASKELTALLDILRYEGLSDGKVTRFHLKKYVKDFYRNHKLNDQKHTLLTEGCLVFGISYEIGNDAPRGGVCGDYIEIKTKNLKSFESIVNQIIEITKGE